MKFSGRKYENICKRTKIIVNLKKKYFTTKMAQTNQTISAALMNRKVANKKKFKKEI